MGRLGVVSTDKLMESANEGSKKGHRRSSQENLDRELAEIKVQLEVMREFVQRNMEDQRYCWVLQRKRIKWIQLQRRLKYDTQSSVGRRTQRS
jgi:hypothetical protein